MELQWPLVALVVLLIAVQARANPWVFGEDHPNFRVIYTKKGHILPLTHNTRQIITVPPCMSLKYVWVKVSNTFGFTPTVKFHKSINVVSISYGLLQHTGSDYSIVAKGFRTPNCNPGVHQPDNNFMPLKGTTAKKIMLAGGKKYRLQRKGQDKEAFDGVDRKNSGANDDLKDKTYGYDINSEDKYVLVKESYEDMSNEMKEVESEKKPYIVFIITGNKASQQATGENGDNVGHDRGSVKGNDGDDYGLDYGNGKDYNHRGSKYFGVGEHSRGKGHTKSSGYDRGTGNAKGDSYRGSDGNRYSKKEAYSGGSGFKSNDGHSMISGYSGSNRNVKDKTSLGYGGSNDENYQGDSYDRDSKSYRHTKNKYSGGNVKGSGHSGSNYEKKYEDDSYDGDIRYVGSSGQANIEGYGGSNGLDDDYLDVFGIDNKNQPDGREKDISMFCSDYLRANNSREGTNLAADKKVMDYCLFEVGRSNF